MAIIVPLIILADDKVVFTAIAPNSVSIGEQFNLKFQVTSSTLKAKEFKGVDIQDFEILTGPTRRVSSSTSVINGKSASTHNITYSYLVQSNQAGNFTIPEATISIDDVMYRSNSIQTDQSTSG